MYIYIYIYKYIYIYIHIYIYMNKIYSACKRKVYEYSKNMYVSFEFN